MKLLIDLENSGFLTPSNVQVVKRFCEKWQVDSYSALLHTHILTEHSIADAIAETYKLERIFSFDIHDADLNLISKVPYETALKLQFLTPYKDEKNRVLIYLLNPTEELLLQYLASHYKDYRIVILDRRLLVRSMEDVYPLHMQMPSLIKNTGRSENA